MISEDRRLSDNEYKSAMSKIEASDTWKTQTLTKMKTAALKQAARQREIENAQEYLQNKQIEKNANTQNKTNTTQAQMENERQIEIIKKMQGKPAPAIVLKPENTIEKEQKLTQENTFVKETNIDYFSETSQKQSAGTRGKSGPHYKSNNSGKKYVRIIAMFAACAAVFAVGFNFILGSFNMGSDAAFEAVPEAQTPMMIEDTAAENADAMPSEEAEKQNTETTAQEGSAHNDETVTGIVESINNNEITLVLNDGTTQTFEVTEQTVWPETQDLQGLEVMITLTQSEGAKEINQIILQ